MKCYDYAASEKFCRSLGLQWFGDAWVEDAAKEAFLLGFTQQQFDAAMRHALIHVWRLFTPQSYTIKQRIRLALHFLFGKAPAAK